MKFDKSKVRYEIQVNDEEFASPEGNASCSGDDDYDRQIEEDIYRRLNAGDVWAWATVCVEARYEGIDNVVGVDYLGCCSYKDEEDFKRGGYYEDMKQIALEDLRGRLEGIFEILS